MATSGTATIPALASSVEVTHTYGSADFVVVWNSERDLGTVTITDKSATAFTINITNVDFEADTDISWAITTGIREADTAPSANSAKAARDFSLTGSVDNASDAGDATHAITVAHGVDETQVVEIAKAGIYSLTLLFDLDVLVTAAEGTSVTVRVYNKIDGTNYSDKAFDKKVFTIASDTEYPFMEYRLLHGYSKVTIQLGSAVTETRTIAYRSITRDLGA
jgi:hypothetical protein